MLVTGDCLGEGIKCPHSIETRKIIDYKLVHDDGWLNSIRRTSELSSLETVVSWRKVMATGVRAAVAKHIVAIETITLICWYAGAMSGTLSWCNYFDREDTPQAQLRAWALVSRNWLFCHNHVRRCLGRVVPIPASLDRIESSDDPTLVPKLSCI